jgi:hypothetical protein
MSAPHMWYRIQVQVAHESQCFMPICALFSHDHQSHSDIASSLPNSFALRTVLSRELISSLNFFMMPFKSFTLLLSLLATLLPADDSDDLATALANTKAHITLRLRDLVTRNNVCTGDSCDVSGNSLIVYQGGGCCQHWWYLFDCRIHHYC